MFKKLLIAILCISFALSLSFTAFAQDDVNPPAEEIEEVTDDSESNDLGTEDNESRDLVESEGENTVTAETQTEAEKAKTFYDGVNTYVNSKVKFKLTTSDNFYADKVMYKINDGAEVEYTEEFSLTEEGKQTVSYYGVDKIGNKEDVKFFRAVVDNTAPEIIVSPVEKIVLIDGKYYTSQNNTFTITTTDKLSGVNAVMYTLNGTDYSEYATSFTFSTNGDTTFRCSAEDNVANKSTKFKIVLPNENGEYEVQEVSDLQLFVDNTKPTVKITPNKEFMDKKGKKVASRDFKYAVSAEDSESGVAAIYYRIDGKGEFVPYEKEIEFQTNGNHFIEAIAVDKVGNKSEVVVLSLYIDIIPPNSEITTISDEDTQEVADENSTETEVTETETDDNTVENDNVTDDTTVTEETESDDTNSDTDSDMNEDEVVE